jgi:Ni,Fe-hydrogenase III large subunit
VCREASDNIRLFCTFTLLDRLNEICSPKVCYRTQKIHCQQCEDILCRICGNCSASPSIPFTNNVELLKRKLHTELQPNAHPYRTFVCTCQTTRYHVTEYNSIFCHPHKHVNSHNARITEFGLLPSCEIVSTL